VEGDEFMVSGADAADELEKLAKSRMVISGQRLIEIAKDVRQIIMGEFRGYETTSSTAPWIIVIAFDSTWFEVRSTDDAALARLKVAFKDVRPVS
jgi:hypothetical protein